MRPARAVGSVMEGPYLYIWFESLNPSIRIPSLTPLDTDLLTTFGCFRNLEVSNPGTNWTRVTTFDLQVSYFRKDPRLA
jgi:hypothetical protein